MRKFNHNRPVITSACFYSCTHILVKLFCTLFFVLTELSECEVNNIITGCTLVADTPDALVGGSTFNICGNRTTPRITPPSLIVLPQSHLPPVEIHSPQLNLIVQTGDTIFLPCAVQNLGDNQLLWRHGNNILIGNHYVPPFDSRRIRFFEDYTLQLSHLALEDSGSYECLVTTTLPMLSVVHTVTVVDPPTLSMYPDTGSLIVTEDETFTLGCIPKGSPLPSIRWIKRDGRIPLDTHLLRMNYITIENATRKDAGLYICKASNQIGAPVFGSVFVRVLHIPEISSATRRVHGGERHPAVLQCTVKSDPRAEVHWLFRQMPIKYTPRVYTEVKGGDYRLILNPVRASDFGMYTCVANNSFGFDARHIELTGVPKQPEITKWDISSCIPNSNRDDKRNKRHQTLPTNQRIDFDANENYFDAPTQSLLSTTITSPDCSIQMTLFWVVESYSPLIDYQLTFRVTPDDMISLQPTRGDQPGHLDTDDEDERHSMWRPPVTIPADPSLSFIHSKAFTTHGIRNGTIFEGGLKARNKWGWSSLSKILNITITSTGGASPRRTDYNPANHKDAVIILISGEERFQAQPTMVFMLGFILIPIPILFAQ